MFFQLYVFEIIFKTFNFKRKLWKYNSRGRHFFLLKIIKNYKIFNFVNFEEKLIFILFCTENEKSMQEQLLFQNLQAELYH